MLKREKNRKYYVYPSWAEGQLTYRWEDLPVMMADPLKYDKVPMGIPLSDWLMMTDSFKNDEYLMLNYKKQRLLEIGYPEKIQPYDFIKGPIGGGIIEAHISEDEKWLPACILNKEANLCVPSPMEAGDLYQTLNVRYLDLMSTWDMETGVRRRVKNYTMGISAEPIESDPDSQYWLLSVKPGKKEPKQISEIPVWAYHFGIEMERLTNAPEKVKQEISPWLKPGFDYVWFKIRQKDDRYGWHFAVMLYIGLHLAYVAKSRVRTMHMLAKLEAKYGPYGIEMSKIF